MCDSCRWSLWICRLFFSLSIVCLFGSFCAFKKSTLFLNNKYSLKNILIHNNSTAAFIRSAAEQLNDLGESQMPFYIDHFMDGPGNVLYYRQTTYNFMTNCFYFCVLLSGSYPATTISQPLFVIFLTFSIVDFQMLLVVAVFVRSFFFLHCFSAPTLFLPFHFALSSSVFGECAYFIFFVLFCFVRFLSLKFSSLFIPSCAAAAPLALHFLHSFIFLCDDFFLSPLFVCCCC